MRDFSNVAEKDCVRLIIAQDLKEYGIDVDANLGGGLGNLSCSNATNTNNFGYHFQTSKNSCQQHNSYHHHNHNHSLNTHHCSHHTFSLFHPSSSNKHHNKSNISTNLISDLNSNSSSGSCTCRINSNQHDSQLSSSISPSTRVFGISLKQIEFINVVINDQVLTVPRYKKNIILFY